jgi:hypothetical protein
LEKVRAIRADVTDSDRRVEAHVFIAFLAYCLHVTLARRLDALAPGLTPRSVLEKFAAVQMIARTRAQLVAEQTEAGAARPTTPQNHRCACAADPVVVPTFEGPPQ